MNMRTRLKRGAIGALVALMIFAAGAFAEDNTSGTETTTAVTVASISGTRTLAVTGSDLTGVPNLSFGPNTTSAPMGLLVTDLTHEQIGYEVTATLTDLYKLNADGSLACSTTSIPSGAFSVSFAGADRDSTGLTAVIDQALMFTDDPEDNLNALIGDETITTLTSTVTGLVGEVDVADQRVNEVAVTDLSDTSLFFMGVSGGTEGDPFDGGAVHPDCSSTDPSGSATDTVLLQKGTVNDPEDTLQSVLFADAANADGTATELLATEAEGATAALLPAGATSPPSTVGGSDGGVIWHATYEAVDEWLQDNLISLNASELHALVTSVVEELAAESVDLVIDMIGQSGVYANVPALDYDETTAGSPGTGSYHGKMTITIFDRD